MLHYIQKNIWNNFSFTNKISKTLLHSFTNFISKTDLCKFGGLWEDAEENFAISADSQVESLSKIFHEYAGRKRILICFWNAFIQTYTYMFLKLTNQISTHFVFERIQLFIFEKALPKATLLVVQFHRQFWQIQIQPRLASTYWPPQQ